MGTVLPRQWALQCQSCLLKAAPVEAKTTVRYRPVEQRRSRDTAFPHSRLGSPRVGLLAVDRAEHSHKEALQLE